MRMLKNVLKLSVVATIALCITSCGGGNAKKASEKLNANDLEKLEIVGQKIDGAVDNMIPSNAVAALRIQPKQLWGKAFDGLDSYNRYQLENMIDGICEHLPILREPETLGLNLEMSVVLSVSLDIRSMEPFKGNVETCIVASLSNRDNFIKQLDNFVQEINRENEYKITKTSLGEKYVHYMIYADDQGAFDLGVFANAAVLRVTYAPSSIFAGMPTTLAKLFANGAPANSEGLNKFYSSYSDVALWVDFEKSMNNIIPLAKEYGGETAKQFKQLEQFMPMYKGASLVSELSFNEGNTVLEFAVYGSEKLKEQALKYNTPSSDKYFKYLPSSSALVLNVAIKDFPGLVEELSKTNSEFADLFESLEPIGFDKELFEGFPGVITVALDGYQLDGETPHIALFMECDANLWDLLASYIYEVADEAGPNLYCIDGKYYIGYVDGAIMLMDSTIMRRMEYGYVDSFSETELAGEINKGGSVINFEEFPYDMLNDAARNMDNSFSGYDFLEYLSSVVITTSSDFMSATIKVNMGDPYQNFLSKVFNFALNRMK